MTPQELLDRLPTVQELLEHPRVRQTAERWNQSAVASRLRTAIAEVGAEVARRAEPWQGMTAGEIVEDLVRRIDRTAGERPTAAINATGELFCDGLVGPPLPDAALEAVAAFSAGYRVAGDIHQADIASLVGAEAVWVGANHAAAVCACFEKYARDGSLVVARRDMGLLGGGVRLESVCQSAGVMPREVGVAEGATPSDYAEALSGAGSDLVYVRPQEPEAALREIADAVRKKNGRLLVDVADGTPIDLREEYGIGMLSAASAIEQGADLVVLRGDGLFGGPESAFAFGGRTPIEELSSLPLSGPRQASAITREMLRATACLFREPKRLKFTHPLYELISAPSDNLRTRAERLAPQIAEHPRVDSAETVSIPAPPLNSWGIALSIHGETAEHSRERLQTQSFPVYCDVWEGRLQIDLRTVFPRQDMALVDALA